MFGKHMELNLRNFSWKITFWRVTFSFEVVTANRLKRSNIKNSDKKIKSFALHQKDILNRVFVGLYKRYIIVLLKDGANQSNISFDIFSTCLMKCWMKITSFI